MCLLSDSIWRGVCLLSNVFDTSVYLLSNGIWHKYAFPDKFRSHPPLFIMVYPQLPTYIENNALIACFISPQPAPGDSLCSEEEQGRYLQRWEKEATRAGPTGGSFLAHLLLHLLHLLQVRASVESGWLPPRKTPVIQPSPKWAESVRKT